MYTTYIDQARKYPARIGYNEIADPRVQSAVIELVQEGFDPVIIGTESDLEQYFGDTLKQIDSVVIDANEDSLEASCRLLNQWKIDGLISGASHTTSETLRTYIKEIGTAEGVHRISSFFLMDTHYGLKVFADCAVQPNPNADQLAEIAYLSTISAQQFGLDPRVAMLSFSTHGSADHPMVDKVRQATDRVEELFATKGLDILVDGEVQLDAAISSPIAHKKLRPDAEFYGEANVLIFPDLNAGNIGYKLVQYLGDSQAVGPMIQWLKKPANDLSRGASISDIKVLHALTVLQARD